MLIVKSSAEMQRISRKHQRTGKRVGFVPTMGFLHEGHLSLLDISKRKADLSVMSIYVNPTQFGPNEDFKKYPRSLARDKRLAAARGCDVLFLPRDRDLYPNDHLTTVNVPKITEALCGRSRPGHFAGVATIVTKLFNIVRPDIAIFGWKDAQQLAMIKRVVKDLHLGVRIFSGPVIREKDGLAMSSRNRYLSQIERERATVIYRSLRAAKKTYLNGESNAIKLINSVTEKFRPIKGMRVDYVEIVEKNSMTPIIHLKGKKAMMAVAVFFGKTRLIDNITLE